MQEGKRSFTIVKTEIKGKGCSLAEHGRYISKTPKGAAKKAFTRECRSRKLKGKCSMKVIIRETTSGSKNKIFEYRFERTKLKTPIKLQINGTEVEYKYQVTGKSV